MILNEIKYKSLTMSEARRWADEIDQYSDDEFAMLVNLWSSLDLEVPDAAYVELRSVVINAFKRIESWKPNSKSAYKVDVEVGLDLYEYLSQNGFTIVEASDDDIWRYIAIKIFPDITYLRFPIPEKDTRERGGRINRKRFFFQTRRLWLKTLWWYVHLSWQGSKDRTRDVIKDNGSNIVGHFIETPGRGYRTDLHRALMKRFASRDDKSDKLFSSIMILNGAECRNLEPALLPGGIEEYCTILFDKVEHNGRNQ